MSRSAKAINITKIRYQVHSRAISEEEQLRNLKIDWASRLL